MNLCEPACRKRLAVMPDHAVKADIIVRRGFQVQGVVVIGKLRRKQLPVIAEHCVRRMPPEADDPRFRQGRQNDGGVNRIQWQLVDEPPSQAERGFNALHVHPAKLVLVYLPGCRQRFDIQHVFRSGT